MKFDIGELVAIDDITPEEQPRFSPLGSQILFKHFQNSDVDELTKGTFGVIINRWKSDVFHVLDAYGTEEWDAYEVFCQEYARTFLLYEMELKKVE